MADWAWVRHKQQKEINIANTSLFWEIISSSINDCTQLIKNLSLMQQGHRVTACCCSPWYLLQLHSCVSFPWTLMTVAVVNLSVVPKWPSRHAGAGQNLLSGKPPKDGLIAVRKRVTAFMYIPFQVNICHKSILLVLQYKYLKSSSEDFILKNPQKSDSPHKTMR